MGATGRILTISCALLIVLIFYLSLQKEETISNSFIQQKTLPEVILRVDSMFTQTGFHLLYEAAFRLEKKEFKDECEINMHWQLPREVLVDIETVNRENKIKAKVDKFIDIEAPANHAQPFALTIHRIPDKIFIKLQARYIQASPNTNHYEFSLQEPKFIVKCGQRNGIFIEDEDLALITEQTAKRTFDFIYKIKSISNEFKVKIPVMPKRKLYFYATISMHTTLSLLFSGFLLKPFFNKMFY